MGHRATLTTAAQTLTGTVTSADETSVTLDVDGTTHTVAYPDVTGAQMVVTF